MWPKSFCAFDFIYMKNVLSNLYLCHETFDLYHLCIIYTSPMLCCHLQELGNAVAFNCSELDMVLSEVGKVEKWMKRCMDVVGTFGDANSLLDALQKVSICINDLFFLRL